MNRTDANIIVNSCFENVVKIFMEFNLARAEEQTVFCTSGLKRFLGTSL